MRLRDGLHRLGNGLVNAYLVADQGGVTIVDAGLPGYWKDLAAELASMGQTLADVRGIVLTHGHSDHIGFAERARRERGITISVHELDAALARGEIPNPGGKVGPIKPRALLGFLVYAALHGALRTPNPKVVSTFGDGATLDLPGSPRVISLPGHTPGSAALHLPSHDAVLVGDALATWSMAGPTMPVIAAFSADPDQARASLARLRDIEAGWLLPGHGEPWTAGVAAAIAHATTAAGGPKSTTEPTDRDSPTPT